MNGAAGRNVVHRLLPPQDVNTASKVLSLKKLQKLLQQIPSSLVTIFLLSSPLKSSKAKNPGSVAGVYGEPIANRWLVSA